MAKKSYTTEQIIGYLRQGEVLLSQGKTLDAALREIGVTRNTYYRWRKQYGGMKADQAKRLKELETENARLKRAVADRLIDGTKITKKKSTLIRGNPERLHWSEEDVRATLVTGSK